ncbi:50S ribosomal protein L22 [Candidatus Peribacteria bacterium]|nr:50S ribosomal protein L22 [Candidatus Peribacteria bacterium]
MHAHLRQQRISQKKANVVAGMIRQHNAVEARDLLRHSPQKAARLWLQVLESAIANAEHNDGFTAESLLVDRAEATRGTYLRRYLPSPRGRALPLQKPTAHLNIYLKPVS